MPAIVLFNSSTGSDSSASGTPTAEGTVLSGVITAVATNTFDWDAGGVPNYDLNQFTAGNHVVYCADPAAGAPNFLRVTGIALNSGTTYRVTTDGNVPAGWNGLTFYIGGKRLSLTGSSKLFRNNSSIGDAMFGGQPIISEMESGYTETFGTGLTFQAATAAQAKGRMILRGAANAAVRPVLTYTNTTTALSIGEYCELANFDLVCSNATKTNIVGVETVRRAVDNRVVVVRNLKITGTGYGINQVGNIYGYLDRVWIDGATTYGVFANTFGYTCDSCWFNNNAINYQATTDSSDNIFVNCIFSNATRGFHAAAAGTGTPYAPARFLVAMGCVFHNNSTSGISSSNANAANHRSFQWQVENCQFTSNGTGIAFNAAATAAYLNAVNCTIRNCNFSGNTLDITAACDIREDCTAVAPAYQSPTAGDFRSSPLARRGFPLSVVWASRPPIVTNIGVPFSSGGGFGRFR